MKILVCLKSVPREIVRTSVSDDASRVLYESLGQAVNESDEYALEQALILKNATGCEVIAASVGSLKCQDVLYLAMAKGANQAIRIDFDTNEPEAIAVAIARAATKLQCDLILTGVESWDNLAAQVGTLVAAKMGIPGAYAVTNIEAGAQPETLTVTKELGWGMQQLLEIPLPAVLCVQSSALPLSYAPPAKIIKARRDPLKSFNSAALDIDKQALAQNSTFKIVDVRVPERKSQAQLFEGDVKNIVESILGRIRHATS